EPTRSWTVRAERVHTAAGDVIEGGFVRVQDGVITAVGPGGGDGDGVLDVGAITPGFVDLSVRIDQGLASVEQVDEATPHVRVADSLDLFDPAWIGQARAGVTTAMVSPPDYNVIGGLSVVVKTSGPERLADRVVAADVALRGCFGTLPSRFNSPAFIRPTSIYVRRPTTRMGVEWVFRKSYYDALVALDEGRTYPGLDQLAATLRGELPLWVQASATQDIRTAIYLVEEFDIPRLVLDAAAEVLKEPELLVRSGAAVVLPPFAWQGRTAVDQGFLPWNTAAELAELGVPFALSAHGNASDDGRLATQAAYAIRGGLSPEAALEAVTIVPARLAGVDDRVGSIEVGKDGDLVLWSGEPFALTSSVVGVIADGVLVLDPRGAAPAEAE
ncbi:MAG TPA: amidohydrolase family protein, partial [Planctomycetota bacterium]|nr:amidohydrolase family protein [Planctomycetota bacterium]